MEKTIPVHNHDKKIIREFKLCDVCKTKNSLICVWCGEGGNPLSKANDGFIGIYDVKEEDIFELDYSEPWLVELERLENT